MASPASIYGTGEPTLELLYQNKPVLILFLFGLTWLTMWAEKPIIGIQKSPIMPQLNFSYEQPSLSLRNSQSAMWAVPFPHQPMFQPPVLNPGSDMLEQDPEEVKLG